MVDDESVDVESVDDAVDEVAPELPVLLAVLDVPVVSPPLACGGGGGGIPPPCCDAAEKRSPRNCWSALLIELDDVLLEVSVADAVELESVLAEDEVEDELEVELLDVVSPI